MEEDDFFITGDLEVLAILVVAIFCGVVFYFWR